MIGEKFIIDCPRCGRVEGFIPDMDEDLNSTPGDADTDIEEQEFTQEGHPMRRIRCPQCGNWLTGDRSRPA